MDNRFFFCPLCSCLIIVGALFLNTVILAGLSQPDVSNPGPDTANFPTSPYTLPKGRAYFENFPLSLDLQGNNQPRIYNWPFLVRIGITNDIEFRLASPGVTSIAAINGRAEIAGFGPVAIGSKVHLWGTEEMLWLPSGGIEFYLITPIASRRLRVGTQCGVNALFHHSFPGKLSLEWNIGFYTGPLSIFNSKRDVYALINWALLEQLIPKLGIFFQGYCIKQKCSGYPVQLVLGLGLQSAVTKRLCIYGNYNWSVYETTNPDIINIGFTVAF